MKKIKNLNNRVFIEQKILEIRRTVGKKRALAAVSGGVDSTTCAVLAHRAIGEQLNKVFIDDGLMRAGEAQEVQRIFQELGLKLEIVEAQKPFFKALAGLTDPEKKRKAFRGIFYQTLAREVRKRKARFLVQGTIKADVVETVGGIKTQHNVLEQIGIDSEKYGFKTIEPLKDLFKPEVRQLAKTLGLPKEIFERMAFPGPGFAVRVLGEVTPEKVALVRQADKIVKQEIMPLRKDPEHPYQAFAVLLSDQATGIREGKRDFGQIIVLRVFDSANILTVEPSKVPWETLRKIQERITSEVPGVCRVLFDLTPKPPATAEFI